MAQFCRVENGEILEGPMELPRSWRNVSGAEAGERGRAWLAAARGGGEAGVRSAYAGARSPVRRKGSRFEATYCDPAGDGGEIDAATPRAPQVIRDLAAALERTPEQIFEMLAQVLTRYHGGRRLEAAYASICRLLPLRSACRQRLGLGGQTELVRASRCGRWIRASRATSTG